jgi:hypothetical protein
MTDAHQTLATLLIAIAALIISIFGDWIKATFRLSGAAKLKLEVDRDEATSQYHHGWIEEANLITNTSEWLTPNQDELGRLRVHFYRVKVTNDSPVAARSVSVWIKKFECCDANCKDKAVENVQPLRWSDFWRLRTDRERKIVAGSDTEIEFKVLPEHSSKYCDLCFYYDPSGPPRIGGLRRNWVYLAVRNVPSSTYAIDGNGRYLVELHVAAENARSVDAIVEIDVNWSNNKSPVSVQSPRKR